MLAQLFLALCNLRVFVAASDASAVGPDYLLVQAVTMAANTELFVCVETPGLSVQI